MTECHRIEGTTRDERTPKRDIDCSRESEGREGGRKGKRRRRERDEGGRIMKRIEKCTDLNVRFLISN